MRPLRRTLHGAGNGADKGRPPPGGEEARVVVYQPRGVGLMHTRHRPGNTHYTHVTTWWRKSSFRSITLTQR